MTSIKEQVINESISRTEKRIKEIEDILNANPLSDIIQLRKDAQSKLETMGHSNPKFLKWIERAAKREKELFDLSEKQIKETPHLITALTSAQRELYELKNELWLIQRNK